MKSQREKRKKKRAKKRLLAVGATFLLLVGAGILLGLIFRCDSALLFPEENKSEKITELLSDVSDEIAPYLQEDELQGSHVTVSEEMCNTSLEDAAQAYLTEAGVKEGLLFGDYVDFFHNVWAAIVQKVGGCEICVVKFTGENKCEVRRYELFK